VPEWSTRQVVYSTLFVALVLVSFALLYRFNGVVLILFIAIVLGTAMRPAVDWLSQHGFSRTGGVIFIYVLLFVLVIGLLVLTLPIVATQVTAILADVPKYVGDFRNILFQSPSRILQRIALQLPADLSSFAPEVPADSGDTLSQVARFFNTAGVFVRGVISMAAVFLLGFYWTQESDRIILNLLLWVPPTSRPRLRELIAEIETRWGVLFWGRAGFAWQSGRCPWLRI
jgi:predicted PurR-regulated permease PerM